MDIYNQAELLDYLITRGWLAPGITLICQVLPGGVSANTVLVQGTTQPMVIKQALSKLKTKAAWFSDPKRLAIEFAALKLLHEHLRQGRVPKALFYDPESFILGMEAITHPHQNFKEVLMSGELPIHLIIQLGALLGQLHQLGFQDQEVAKQFADRSFFKNLRIEPYYEYSMTQLPDTHAFFDALIADTLETTITIVHGDFSPKNVLIKDDELVLLDFEVMHFGDPGFDIGFVLCHFLSKANYHGNELFVEAALTIWKSYREKFSYNLNGFESRCIRHLLGCLIARVHGRSPLEYLTLSQQQWQSDTALKYISVNYDQMEVFLNDFKQDIMDRK